MSVAIASDSPFLTPGNPYDTRVERTFAFIDLSGFTQFTEENGDAEAVKVLGLFRSAVREVSAQHIYKMSGCQATWFLLFFFCWNLSDVT